MSIPPHVGDTGTVIRITITDDNGNARDISNATLKQITLEAPDGGTTDYTASFTTDGTDGQIEYVTQSSSDLDEAGQWSVQAYVEDPSGNYHTETDDFWVESNV